MTTIILLLMTLMVGVIGIILAKMEESNNPKVRNILKRIGML